MLTAENKNTTYETFDAECPHCHKWNIYSRVSDLKTLEPIAGKDVTCFHCNQSYWITGDTINPAFEMLILECYDLKKVKKYTHCILTLCQACELFFYTFLKIELLYKPFIREGNSGNTDTFKAASLEFRKKTRRLEYKELRNVFLNLLINPQSPASLAESRKLIGMLNMFNKTPKDSEIQTIADSKLVNLCIDLKRNNVHEERNNVIHSRGHRPTRETVEKLLDDTYTTLVRLASLLNIESDDPNYLVNFVKP